MGVYEERGIAPRAVAESHFVVKEDLFGVGYDPHHAAPEFRRAAGDGSAVRRGGTHGRGGASAHAMSAAGRMSGYEDVDDLYVAADMSQYSMTLDDDDEADDERGGAAHQNLRLTNASAVAAAGGGVLRGFVRAQREAPSDKWHQPPPVPASFKERHVFPPQPPPTAPLSKEAEALLVTARGALVNRAPGAAATGAAGAPATAATAAASGGGDGAGGDGASKNASVWEQVPKEEMVQLWLRLQAIQVPPPPPPPAPPPPPPPPSQYPPGAAPTGTAASPGCSHHSQMQRHMRDQQLLGMHACGAHPAHASARGGGPPPPPLRQPPPPPPSLPARPPQGYSVPEGCTPYQNEPQKQRRFDAFLRDEHGARAMAQQAGLTPRVLHSEIAEFHKVRGPARAEPLACTSLR